MKKQMIFLVLTALLTILLCSTVSAAATFNNSTNNRTNYTHEDIQPVINNITTEDNDTVLIKQGNYNAVNLTKRLTLQWDGNGTKPVIPSIYIGPAGSGSRLIGLHIKNIMNLTGSGITLDNTSNVTIEDCVIEGFIGNAGILLLNASNNTIIGSNITNNSEGIRLDHSSNNTLSGNTITSSNYNGIRLYDSSNNNTLSGNNITNSSNGIGLDHSSNNNTISGNTIIDNDRDGIYLSGSSNNTLSGNTITNSSNGIGLYYSSNNTLSGNTITSSSEGISLYDSSNNTLSGNNITNSSNGIRLYWSSNNNTLSGNTITGNLWGIRLDYASNNNTLSGNSITNSRDGIRLYDSSNNTISGNTITNNSEGIRLYYSSNNTISGNTITSSRSDGDGIYLGHSSNNTISGNTITSSRSDGDGIYLGHSSNNTISENTVTGSIVGIRLYLSSNNNTLTGNNITDSWHGIRLDDSSNNNTLTGNNIIYVMPCDWWWEAIAKATDDSDGIVLFNSLNNIITGNSITGSWHGIRLNNSLNSIISENNIMDTFDNGIVLINSSNNNISGNSISGNRDDGIVFYGPSNNNTITDNTITDNIENGIIVGESLNNTISGNTITGNRHYGIVLINSSNNNTLSENTITNNTLGGIILSGSQNNDLTSNTVLNNLEGIILENAPSSTLRNNTINNNTRNFGVHGWGDLINYRQDIDISNTINGNPIFYLMDQIDDAFDGIAMGFLGVVNSTNLTFSNLNITNNIQGVLLAGSNNITIRNSSFSYNLDGIYLIESNGINIHGNAISDNTNSGICLIGPSNNNTLSENTITNNTLGGIILSGSSDNTISGNTISDNVWGGIILSGSSDNTISENSITGNVDAILLWDSSNNAITDNTITDNTNSGIWLTDSSNNNTISKNSITGNVDAILLEDSSNNTISRNSITGNWRGIFLRGNHTGNSIHFNRIIPAAGRFAIKNDDPGWVNASYNWYGRNENVTALISGNVTYAPWLILSINATPDAIYTGNISNVTADLRRDSNGTLHNVTFLMDGIPVTFSGTLGTVDPVSGNTTDSSAGTTFTDGGTAGTANVSATVDTQTVSTPIIVVALPTATASLPGGNFYNPVTVNLTSTGGFDPVRIFFTTNGTAPTNTSTEYTTQLTFNATTELRFKAQDNEGTNSTVHTETYNIAALPTASASLPGGNFYNPVTVNLTSTGGFDPVRIFFTTNGTAPTNTSTEYTTQLTFNATTELRFKAQDNEGTNSTVHTETYNIAALPTASASQPGGNFYNPVTVNLTSTGGFTPVRIFFTTDGTAPTNTSTVWTAPLTFNATTELRFKAQDSLGTNSTVHTEIYNIAALPTASASQPGGNFYNPVTVNLTSTGGFTPVRIFFTTNGTAPTNTSTLYAAPLTFNTTTELRFFAQDSLGTNSTVHTEIFNIAAPLTAAASLPGGNYHHPVIVALTSTGGFTPVGIFFTTNGTTPTNASTRYTAPLTFNTTTELRFKAQDRLGTNSSVHTETFNIYRQVAYTYSVSVPVIRWVRGRVWRQIRGRVWRQIGDRWRRVWGLRWARVWGRVRVIRTTTEHRTGHRWELT